MQLAGLFAHESGLEAKFSREKAELISNQRICTAKAESDGVVYVTDRGILLSPKNPTRDARCRVDCHRRILHKLFFLNFTSPFLKKHIEFFSKSFRIFRLTETTPNSQGKGPLPSRRS